MSFLFLLSFCFANTIDETQCLACIMQRKGNLAYILRRAIHQSGPDENETFGHCFVCVRCQMITPTIVEDGSQRIQMVVTMKEMMEN